MKKWSLLAFLVLAVLQAGCTPRAVSAARGAAWDVYYIARDVAWLLS